MAHAAEVRAHSAEPLHDALEGSEMTEQSPFSNPRQPKPEEQAPLKVAKL